MQYTENQFHQAAKELERFSLAPYADDTTYAAALIIYKLLQENNLKILNEIANEPTTEKTSLEHRAIQFHMKNTFKK